MWPWEHAAVGYLLYSLGRRASGRGPPTESETVALVVATQLPDLVDKPLSWGLGWFPSGYAVGHSVFVAVPVGLATLALGWKYGRRRVSAALVVGHWSHLVGDVLNPIRSGGRPLLVRVLWPVVEAEPYPVDHGLGRGLVYLGDFFAAVPTMDPLDLVLRYVLLPVVTVVIWLFDGAPGTAYPRRVVAVVRGHAG